MKAIKIILFLLASALTVSAQDVPFTVADGLFDQNDANSAGLQQLPTAQTFTVFAPSDATDHYSHGVVMTTFKGALYCMWQSSKTDEDATDTWVAYARSTDGGMTWTSPMVLCPTIDNGYCASGGWVATDDQLTAFINTRPSGLTGNGGYTRYVASTDGISWTSPADVTMADGSQLNGIMEQDPHKLSSGRIVSAAHFQPGTQCYPIYTDDPTGRTGWHKAAGYTFNSNLMEPSMYVKADGNIVMIFRDQASSYYKYACQSSDEGETWTTAVKTNMPDCREKQSAGNLPDGTAFMAGCPIRAKKRAPLTLTLSTDGGTFDRAWLLRSVDDLQTMRYTGKYKNANSGYSYPKSMVSGDYLYVAYAANKEDVQYTRVPLSAITTGINSAESGKNRTTDSVRYNLAGQRVSGSYKGIVIRNGKKYFSK